MISVVIPTYNRRSLIGGAISSVLDGQKVECEIIVVDDGSTDGVGNWLLDEYAGLPVRVIANTRNKGPAGARNAGILAAKGEFVALLDSDDRFLPEHLAACLRTFAAFPVVEVVFGSALYEQNGVTVEYMGPNFVRTLDRAPTAQRNESIRVFAPEFFQYLLQSGCFFNLSTVVMRVGAARELMNETLRIGEDYEFWVRLSRNHRFACLNRPQIRYVLHDNNVSFENSASPSDCAPDLLAAYEIMSSYPALGRKEKRYIKENTADVLFSWAYRCRKHRQLREAIRLHLRSMRFGKRLENVVALIKISLVGLFPRFWS